MSVVSVIFPFSLVSFYLCVTTQTNNKGGRRTHQRRSSNDKGTAEDMPWQDIRQLRHQCPIGHGEDDHGDDEGKQANSCIQGTVSLSASTPSVIYAHGNKYAPHTRENWKNNGI